MLREVKGTGACRCSVIVVRLLMWRSPARSAGGLMIKILEIEKWSIKHQERSRTSSWVCAICKEERWTRRQLRRGTYGCLRLGLKGWSPKLSTCFKPAVWYKQSWNAEFEKYVVVDFVGLRGETNRDTEAATKMLSRTDVLQRFSVFSPSLAVKSAGIWQNAFTLKLKH